MTTMVTAHERVQRLERVRAALEKAETATGLRPVGWGRSDAREATVEPVRPAPEAGSGRQVLPVDTTWIPAPEALATLVPHGAFRRGSTAVVTGSTSLMLHTAAALMTEGAWCALVSYPDLGLAAALDAGIDPARCAVIPRPGPDAAAVLSAVTDGFDVVVVGHCTALNERDRRSISQRVRHRGAVLLSSRPWLGSDVTLTVTSRAGRGLTSRGRLVAEELEVTGTGRGAGGGAPRRARMHVLRQDGVTHLLPGRSVVSATASPGLAPAVVTEQIRRAG